MSRLKTAKIMVCFPGQAIKMWPMTESLKEDPGLAAIVDSCWSAFESAVGKDLATAALQADNKNLEENTLLGQLRSFYASTVMWLALLNYSPNKKELTAGKLMEEGLLQVQLSGDSAGFVTAAHAPGPGHIDDQLTKLQEGARNMRRRGELMLETPHDYTVGGMAVVTRLPGWVVNRMVGMANNRLKHANLVQVVKHNAPRLKVVAGPKEGLDMLAQYVSNRKGGFIGGLSPYWFHHSLAMELAGKLFGLYLAGDDIVTQPSPLLKHVSYVTGHVTPSHKLVEDMARGVWNPVYFYTFRGPSVHGAAHKNGFYDMVVMNQEITNWLRNSQKVATHLMNDLVSVAATQTWIMQVVNGAVQQGKQLVTASSAPSLQVQVQPSTGYQAQS